MPLYKNKHLILTKKIVIQNYGEIENSQIYEKIFTDRIRYSLAESIELEKSKY